jgi:hypothetical protein
MFLTIAFISFLVVLLAMIFAPSDSVAIALAKSTESADESVEGFVPALHT